MKQPAPKDELLLRAKHIHMIGIGGSGMCPLAEILFRKGYAVTGSDRTENDLTARMREMGITVYGEQHEENVNGAELVVYSAAVHPDNPERVAAKKLGIPEMERSELLGALTRKYNNVIGVSGTHGKTSVTSMITHILLLNKMEPTSVIGGKLPVAGSYCTVGNSENMVVESCEFVDSFLKFSPDISVLLNIDNDHLDYFGTMENLEKSFQNFVSLSNKCYAFGDDERVMRVTEKSGVKTVTYGFEKKNDYYAANITSGRVGYNFTVMQGETALAEISLSVPGKHNILNALVSFAVCYEMGVSVKGIAETLKQFTGAGRRFEVLLSNDRITVADDYAHHPTEIAATLKAAKSLTKGKVIAAFQPFTYSRVANLKDGMIKALSLADVVFLTPIVASREENIYGVSSEQIASALGGEVISDYDLLASRMMSAASDGDIILTMGAGDIYKVARIMAEKLK